MKRLLHGLFLLPLALFLLGCGINIKYTDRKDFTEENEKERKELYKDVLSSIGVDTVDKFALMYIDYIMTESDKFKTLEKMNPTDNFSDFFVEVIPILYYSYSPITYKSVPKEWKNRTTTYLFEQNPYPLNSGEKKFRKWWETKLKNESWYIFPFYDKDEPEKKALGSQDYEKFPKLIATFAWVEEFNYSEFKLLSKSSQATLISTKAILNYVQNGHDVDDDAKKTFEKVEKRWEQRADDFLGSPKFVALEDDASVSEVIKIAINLIVNTL